MNRQTSVKYKLYTYKYPDAKIRIWGLLRRGLVQIRMDWQDPVKEKQNQEMERKYHVFFVKVCEPRPSMSAAEKIGYSC